MTLGVKSQASEDLTAIKEVEKGFVDESWNVDFWAEHEGYAFISGQANVFSTPNQTLQLAELFKV